MFHKLKYLIFCLQLLCWGSAHAQSDQFENESARSEIEAEMFAPTGSMNGNWRECANEGGTCFVNGYAQVAYGANGIFTYRNIQGAISCSNNAFGMDPVPNVVKACFVLEQNGGGNNGGHGSNGGAWRACASEGGTCVVNGYAQVAYGANGIFTYRNVQGAISCSNAAFGGDPVPNVVKACFIVEQNGGDHGGGHGNEGGPGSSNDWRPCASEHGRCVVNGYAQVAFGANGIFTYRNVQGAISCTNEAFGGDPVPNVFKACFVREQGGHWPH